MLKSKTITLVCCIATAVMLVLAIVILAGKAATGRNNTNDVGYEALFDKSYVHSIDIEIDDWEGFISTAMSEEYAVCNVTIDGEKVKGVGIRAKGNTSLSSVASQGSEKYSFKIEFDQFVDGRLYRGLDKLSLNNLIYDATMMKDYISYTLMGEMGVPSPLCSFVEITVNGEYWGIYLAVEGIEDGFLERNNMTRGELYKPDSMSFGGGRGNGRDFDIDQFRVDSDGSDQDTSGATSSSQTMQAPSGMQVPTDMQAPADMASGSGFPGGSMTSGFPGSDTSGFPGGMGGMGGMSFPGGDFSSFSGQPDASQMPSGQMPSGQMPSGQMPDMSGGTMPSSMPSSMPSGDFTPGQMPSGDFTPGQIPSGDFTPGQMPSGDFPAGDFSSGDGSSGFSMAAFGGGMFNFGIGGSDVKLQYIDDEFDSYSNIFNNAKTVVTKVDKRRLINALKKLNSGEDIEDTVFTDEVITYMAVHDFLQNGDSYTGMMVHNYYLYEENGQLAIIPWDYNLAFGGFNGGDGSSLVNSPIDSPVANGNASDRPLIGWIFNDEEALEQYHETYSRFVSEYIESGWLDAEITRVAKMIRQYVAEDKNSFYSVEEFDAAVEALRTYCSLRGESIRGQLDGTIPSTTAGQRTDSSALVDASGLNVSAMGSMGGGGGGGFSFGGGGGGFSRSGSDSGSDRYGSRSTSDTDTSAWSQFSPGNMPGGTDFSGMPGNQASGQSRSASSGTSSESRSSESRGSGSFQPGGGMPSGFSWSGGDIPLGFGSSGSSSSSRTSWTDIAIYVGILLVAIAAVVLIVRKHND